MARTYDMDGSESGSIPERQQKKKQKLAQNISGMPDYVYESIKRQYKGGPDYTIEDKKNVIKHYMKQKKGQA